MQHSTRSKVLWLLIVASLAIGIGGCDPGPNVWSGVKNPAPVSPQPKEAGR